MHRPTPNLSPVGRRYLARGGKRGSVLESRHFRLDAQFAARTWSVEGDSDPRTRLIKWLKKNAAINNMPRPRLTILALLSGIGDDQHFVRTRYPLASNPARLEAHAIAGV